MSGSLIIALYLGSVDRKPHHQNVVMEIKRR